MQDLLKRGFAADRPGTKFVGDMRAELVERALSNDATTTRIEPNAIWHSDRGSVYTPASLRALAISVGTRSSMGEPGTCWDNVPG